MTLWDFLWAVRRAFREQMGLPYGELARRQAKKEWEASKDEHLGALRSRRIRQGHRR
jgi:hypothetical protein